MSWLAKKARCYRLEVLSLSIMLAVGACDRNPVDESGFEPPNYPQIDQHPAWSPDGTTIAYYHLGVTQVDSSGFCHIDPESAGIWFINPDGTNRRMFLRNGSLPDWSADGTKLALVIENQIYTVGIGGDSLCQWTTTESNYFPDWCSNGELIGYDRIASFDSSGVWVLSLADNQKVYLVHGRSPDWSPDCSLIVYAGLDEEIWRVSSDGSDSSKLAGHSGDFPRYRYPVWSPDGSKIAFSALEAGEPIQIWVMDADGSNPRHLTTEGGTEPSWSPDGSKIVYSRHNSWEFSDENGRLWVMNADGSGKRQLTSF